MKRFLRILKILGLFLLFLAAALVTLKLILDKPMPNGEEGAKAEALAQRMLSAVNDSAWRETRAIAWNFDNRHQVLWDRERHLASISWDEHEVLLNCQTEEGLVFTADRLLEDEGEEEILEQAYFFWVNDSYWLNPVTKIYDPGVQRKYVETEDGLGALLVTYRSGGLTPGDSYLWYVDEKGLPYQWEMWVKIIPIKGLKGTWEDWIELTNGARISTRHALGPATTRLLEVHVIENTQEWVGEKDPFSELIRKKS